MTHCSDIIAESHGVMYYLRDLEMGNYLRWKKTSRWGHRQWWDYPVNPLLFRVGWKAANLTQASHHRIPTHHKLYGVEAELRLVSVVWRPVQKIYWHVRWRCLATRTGKEVVPIDLNGMVGQYLVDNRRELENESTFGAYLLNNLPRTRSQRADNWMKANDAIPMQESQRRTWAGGPCILCRISWLPVLHDQHPVRVGMVYPVNLFLGVLWRKWVSMMRVHRIAALLPIGVHCRCVKCPEACLININAHKEAWDINWEKERQLERCHRWCNSCPVSVGKNVTSTGRVLSGDWLPWEVEGRWLDALRGVELFYGSITLKSLCRMKSITICYSSLVSSLCTVRPLVCSIFIPRVISGEIELFMGWNS